MPKIFVILFGCAAKPEEGDEVKGYHVDSVEAKRYCDFKNILAPDGYSYWYEETNILPTV